MSGGFVVTRTDGSCEVVKAATAVVEDGVLVFTDSWGAFAKAVGPGAWVDATPAEADAASLLWGVSALAAGRTPEQIAVLYRSRVARSRDTLKVWLERYWERESPQWARSTCLYRGQMLDKWIEPYIGGVRLRDLGTARVRKWLANIAADGCSPGQRNHAHRVLSASLGVAVRDGALPANPCQGIRRAPHTPARPRALTPAEIEHIRVEMPTVRDALMVSLMGYGGLRPEEVVPLRWSDLASGVIVVDRAYTCGELKGTKTGARRAVEIVAPLADDIAARRPGSYAEGDLIAPSRSGGFLDWGNWRNRVWGPAAVAAGFSREVVRRDKRGREKVATVAPYDLRHSFASLLIHGGMNPLLVAAAMGHSSGQLIWSTYGHMFEAARLAPAVAMVDAILAAREELHKSCTTQPERHLRLVS